MVDHFGADAVPVLRKRAEAAEAIGNKLAAKNGALSLIWPRECFEILAGFSTARPPTRRGRFFRASSALGSTRRKSAFLKE
jgi:hypothetical protein